VGEALIMTAAGLAVAIPAVLAYNVFGRASAASRPTWKALRATCAKCCDRPARLGGASPAAAFPTLRAAADLRHHGFRPPRTHQGQQPMSDINMTPLVDVMLVLVVIFIITAPLLASSIRLDLPKTDAATPDHAAKFVPWWWTRPGRSSWRTSR
jgi:hypothetical protein